ncbi:hypothetical protein HBB16_20275 [Pseudonocardia sp. MCCB 268]|nr:hypothetical protein [Pseudonocardia cytotoxica]
MMWTTAHSSTIYDEQVRDLLAIPPSLRVPGRGRAAGALIPIRRRWCSTSTGIATAHAHWSTRPPTGGRGVDDWEPPGEPEIAPTDERAAIDQG